jgi:dCTP deaminase
MLLNDNQIINSRILSPSQNYQVRHEGAKKVLSYGVSSFGYDIRLADAEVKIFSDVNRPLIDPKNFNEYSLIDAEIIADDSGGYFILPPGTCALTHSYEMFSIPLDVIGVCLGKSTYARCGILINVTPLEPGWCGFLTIEIANLSPSPCKIYLLEGIAQILFLKGDEPGTSYADGDRKYQNQSKQVVLPKL